MHWIDWTVVVVYLVWIVWSGLQHTRDSKAIEGYFLANRSLPWWAVGLSVMATQLSAITMIGTTGQAYADGMRFLQFYYALPLAMIILSVTLVPFFYRARVYTAYEYLERRFDAKTRSLTSLLFLLSRGMSCGVIISAPAVVLSVVFGWNLTLTCLAIGLPTAAYTMLGGVQAVTWTDVKQMYLIVFGLVATVVALVLGLPAGIGMGDALHIAGATGRLQTFDFTFSLTDQYTFWSGTIAALFLFASYFGTDQSQVQRYLTAKSIDQARSSLLMSAYWKIPLQALVLLVGVLLFVYYLFTPPPMLFNPVHEARVRAGAGAADYAALEGTFAQAATARRERAQALAQARRAGDGEALGRAQDEFRASEAELKRIRAAAVDLVRKETGDGRYNDVNYVFPTFVLSQLPTGTGGADPRRHLRGRDVEHRRRAERALDRDGDRLLPPLLPQGGAGRPLPLGVARGDRRVGPVHVRRGDLRRRTRVADRGGQPLRVVLLRLDPRRLHPRDRVEARQRTRARSSA